MRERSNEVHGKYDFTLKLEICESAWPLLRQIVAT